MAQGHRAECGRLYACQMWGILAPTPMWLPVMKDHVL